MVFNSAHSNNTKINLLCLSGRTWLAMDRTCGSGLKKKLNTTSRYDDKHINKLVVNPHHPNLFQVNGAWQEKDAYMSKS